MTALPSPIVAPPEPAEMALRLARVRGRMASEALDAYVVFCPDNVFYLTNFHNYVHERPFVLVVSERGPLRFVVPQLEEEHVRVRAVGEIDLVRYFELPAPAGEAWSDRLRDDARRSGAHRRRIHLPTCMIADEIPGTRVRSRRRRRGADGEDRLRDRPPRPRGSASSATAMPRS